MGTFAVIKGYKYKKIFDFSINFEGSLNTTPVYYAVNCIGILNVSIC